ncbi:MAG: sensor domain-containing protein [Mycobacterium sp.]
MRLTRLVCGLCAMVVIAAGCVNTTGGTAKPVGAGPGTSAAPTKPTNPGDPDSPLERFLLSVDDINTVMGTNDIELAGSANDLSDHRNDISDPQCLGALYNAEEAVYEKAGWTDVVDQVLTEPEDDSSHWVEQTVVQFPSAEAAQDFFDSSFTQWTDCIGKTVMVDDGDYEFNWQFEGISSVDGTISQTARQIDSDGWACQHALGAVKSYILETSVCGLALKDEAVSIVDRLAANVK